MTWKGAPKTHVKTFLEEVQEYVYKGWDGVNKIGFATRAGQKGASHLSNLQRLHDLVELLIPHAPDDVRAKAEEIASGNAPDDEENDDDERASEDVD
jgi:hypothetical protein